MPATKHSQMTAHIKRIGQYQQESPAILDPLTPDNCRHYPRHATGGAERLADSRCAALGEHVASASSRQLVDTGCLFSSFMLLIKFRDRIPCKIANASTLGRLSHLCPNRETMSGQFACVMLTAKLKRTRTKKLLESPPCPTKLCQQSLLPLATLQKIPRLGRCI